MVTRVSFSPQAKVDLRNIFDYLFAEWSEKVAIDFLNKVFDKINFIKSSPERGFYLSRKKQIRKALIVTQISLVYRIKNDELEIVSFFHNRQDPKKLKRIIKKHK